MYQVLLFLARTPSGVTRVTWAPPTHDTPGVTTSDVLHTAAPHPGPRQIAGANPRREGSIPGKSAQRRHERAALADGPRWWTSPLLTQKNGDHCWNYLEDH